MPGWVKNRDITLLMKVHLVKAMVSLVVMYGCESWTISLNCLWPHLIIPGTFCQGPISPQSKIYSVQTLTSKRYAVMEKHSYSEHSNL